MSPGDLRARLAPHDQEWSDERWLVQAGSTPVPRANADGQRTQIPARFDSLVDLLDDAAVRYPGDRAVLSLRTDQGIVMAWSLAEVRRRSRLAAWRLHALGLRAGDRLLTWSTSTPQLPAVYWGAMRPGSSRPARPADGAGRPAAHR